MGHETTFSLDGRLVIQTAIRHDGDGVLDRVIENVIGDHEEVLLSMLNEVLAVEAEISGMRSPSKEEPLWDGSLGSQTRFSTKGGKLFKHEAYYDPGGSLRGRIVGRVYNPEEMILCLEHQLVELRKNLALVEALPAPPLIDEPVLVIRPPSVWSRLRSFFFS